VHFFADADAADIAWKALAVNVSDLIAKGARPVGYVMALSFPDEPSARWLKRFAAGLKSAQAAFGLTLLGGDTDRAPGPLSVAITAFGEVPTGRMVQRGTARVGDRVFVSGTLGDAALGLALVKRPLAAIELRLLSHQCDFVLDRYDRPTPRVALAPLLLAYASASMDISDGLLKDARRMADASGVALALQAEALPLSDAMARALAANPARMRDVVAHGDDYEVLFTVPEAGVATFLAAAQALPFRVTEIGVVTKGAGAVIADADGTPLIFEKSGYEHF
jgi:thiamine-monophosphate kinase